MYQKKPMETFITTPRGRISIRPAAETDAQAYRQLRLQALHDHPEAFSSDYAVIAARPAEYWTERLTSLGSEGTLHFATYSDHLIGMTGIVRGDSPKTRHSAFIWGVYVQPNWRGLKIAEALIDACAGWAREHEITIIKLGVSTTNNPAIRCYTRCGFQVYGTEPQALYANGVLHDELLMARTI